MNTDKQAETKLWWLQELGLDGLDNSKTEWTCVCPFCDDERSHFYLNSEKLLYDCKKCGESGNYLPLMAQLASNLAECLDEYDLSRLAKNRKLPVVAFAGFDFGWTGTFYTLPVRNADGKVVNVLRYKLGGKLCNAPDCKAGLFGAEQLADNSRKEEPVYLVEGPWDAIALKWLQGKARKPGVVTAVLGAGHLPDADVKSFRGREVFVVHDNDEAGAKGESRIATKLLGVAKTLHFYRWEEDEPQGKDIRDIVVEGLQL